MDQLHLKQTKCLMALKFREKVQLHTRETLQKRIKCKNSEPKKQLEKPSNGAYTFCSQESAAALLFDAQKQNDRLALVGDHADFIPRDPVKSHDRGREDRAPDMLCSS
jgi:hypothetical protein